MIRMNKIKGLIYFVICTWLLMFFTVIDINAQKQIIIEDFDSGSVNLTSYPVEDEDPQDWELNSITTYNNSPWSLRIYGNTWKVQNISPIQLDSGDVWQVSAYIASEAEIQGFAIMDAIQMCCSIHLQAPKK